IPAWASDRLRHAEETGTRAVTLAKEKITPDQIITQASVDNAMKTLLAIGGSTNGIVHMAAVAGRLGLKVDLDAFDKMGREVPTLVNLKPNGAYYMEDLWKAGGLTTILREIEDLLNLDCPTVNGKTLGENLAAQPPGWDQDVVRTRVAPLYPEGGMVVLRGNLSPNGAILKQSAADQGLLVHEGRAVVFENLEDLANRIDSPDLDVTADDVLVLRNIGPKGAPGMPEAGYIPIPKKLAAQGVKDMVRISDGRMSGTAFGTIILHVSPESADGGPLALVQNGDRIKLDTPNRTLNLLVDDTEMKSRRDAWTPPPAHAGSDRGYLKLYLDTVNQAEEGADFDFLRATGEA
ncbi:MAG TPA: dihydroxy-acid dehydratase, partial [Rhodospirillaceae bacterium]|nr:dihydroxy-acid dehydratase [Rhodospirillaceae bacterium]